MRAFLRPGLYSWWPYPPLSYPVLTKARFRPLHFFRTRRDWRREKGEERKGWKVEIFRFNLLFYFSRRGGKRGEERGEDYFSEHFQSIVGLFIFFILGLKSIFSNSPSLFKSFQKKIQFDLWYHRIFFKEDGGFMETTTFTKLEHSGWFVNKKGVFGNGWKRLEDIFNR